MTTTIKGTITIVPNEMINANAITGRDRALKMYKKLGITIQSLDESPLVQVRTYDDILSENWSDHGVDLSKVPGYTGNDSQRWECLSKNWPSFLPAALFEGKKEGDTITLEGEGVKFELTLKQLGTKYAKGDFKTLLRKLLCLYYSEKSCNWRDTIWTEENVI